MLAAVSGCPRLPKSQVGLDQLVSEYNANASVVEQVWARADITLTWHEGWAGLLGIPFNFDGLLLLKKCDDPIGPHDFCLIGRETMSYEIFRMGVSNSQRVYYFWIRNMNRAWWGRTHLAGAPGIEDIPIDPIGLLSVLGVVNIPQDFTTLPTVSMTMDTNPHDDYAYVLSYIDRQPISKRIGFRRELFFVWHDKKPRRLFKVNFYNMDGRRIMTARLGNWKPINVSEMDNPPEVQPIMPTRIELTSFNKKEEVTARIRIKLSEMTTADIWDAEACQLNVPSDIPDENVLQVDRHLDIQR